MQIHRPTTSTTTPLTTPPVQPVVQQPAVVQGPGVVQPPLLAPQEPDIVSQPFIVGQPGTGAAEGPQSPWVPDIPLPEGVKIPPPRTDLCGSLPRPKTQLEPGPGLLGSEFAIVARIIRNIDAVLAPLGPRGYRVLGRNSIDSLYSMTPDNIRVSSEPNHLPDKRAQSRVRRTKSEHSERWCSLRRTVSHCR